MTDPGPWPDDDASLAAADGALADLEAERWMVAAMMHAPEAFDLAVDGGWRPGDCADGRHGEVVLAVAEMADERRRVDPVTLRARMGDGRVPDGFLDALFRLPAIPGQAGVYAAKVHEAAVRRRLSAAGVRLRAGAMNRGSRLADVLAAAEADLEAATGDADPAADLEDPLALAADEQAKAHEWVIPGLLDRGDRVIVVGDEGGGKALALDTPVPTPKGWTTMGELAAGDQVFGLDGEPCTVLYATRAMHGHPCYRVRFSDGAEIVADAEHLWLTETLRARERAAIAARRDLVRLNDGRDQRHKRTHFPAVVTTEQIGATLLARDGHAVNHSVATCAPLRYPSQELPVPPYTLGAWLGDGTRGTAEITCADEEILGEICRDGFGVTPSRSRPLGFRITIPRPRRTCLLAGSRCAASGIFSRGLCENHYQAEWAAGRVTRWPRMGRPPSLQDNLRRLGVLSEKHIPAVYKQASVAQRLALIAGLMDTDGTVSADGPGTGRGRGRAVCEFSVTSERLARDFHEVILSLGIKATFRQGPVKLRGRDMGTRYRITFQTELAVFRLPRKAARLTPLRTRRAGLRYIEACDPVPPVPVRCIKVDRPDGMFLVGRECIPTHNTILGWQVAVAAASGVHPFWASCRFGAQRALIVDLEVDRGIRARNFGMFTDPAEAAGLDRAGLRVWARPYGLDLRTADGQMTLTQVVRRHRPSLLVAGPMYKMGCTEAEKPGEYKLVSDFLDRLRVRFGCALWLEQHAPMAQGGRPRELRPIGSVLWKQWPEFGFGLAPGSEVNRFGLARFRKDRERGRAWPAAVYWNTGFGWPWLADYAAGEAPGERPLPGLGDELSARRRAAHGES